MAKRPKDAPEETSEAELEPAPDLAADVDALEDDLASIARRLKALTTRVGKIEHEQKRHTDALGTRLARVPE